MLKMAGLNTLPNEILSLITSYLEHPRDIAHLSLTCRHINGFVKVDGWKAYLAGRFGITAKAADARPSVHGITTLYRNWSRKAFVARYLNPSSKSTSLNTWQKSQWTGPSGQTMGYQPSIDSYEEVQGWADRREVLAWSAGTHIAMRVKETGSCKADRLADDNDHEDFDAYRNRIAWHTYQIPESQEGRDDITALKLLRPNQTNGDSDCIAFGTASGDLSLLQVDLQNQQIKREQYKTRQQPISSLSISPDNRPHAATIQGHHLVLYSADLEHSANEALDEIPVAENSGFGGERRPWTCEFTAKDKIAIGLGSTTEAVKIYGLTPSGLTETPLRTFEFTPGPRTSVYAIAPLGLESRAGNDAGNIFLSGAYDGYIRLHDMRSPDGFETVLLDHTNISPIYSMVTQGFERVIAGSSMHSMLKVFDLRFPASHAYSSPSSLSSGAWNLFLHPRHHGSRPRRGHRAEDSPVYSLSLPSATSSSLYAGVEGAVMDLDFLSVMDPYQDTIYSKGIQYLPNTNIVDVERSYNPSGDVFSLGMYEHFGGGEAMDSIDKRTEALSLGPRTRLIVQEEVRGTAVFENAKKRSDIYFAGLDERWKDPSEEGERWTRGQVPQEPAARPADRGGRGRGGNRGRGGRGRGRGRARAQAH
jgi:WD40 repeat protein